MKSAVTLSLVTEAVGGPFVFWHDAITAIRTAQDLGFDALEVFAPDANAVRQLNWSKLAIDFPIAALGTGAGWVKHKLLLCDPTQDGRQAAVAFVADFLKLAGEHGSQVIIGSMQGRSNPNLSKSEALKFLRSSLEELDTQATKEGCTLLFEPLNRYETDLVNTIEDGCSLTKELLSTKVLGDLFHMNIEEHSIENTIQQFGDRIGHIHFADTNRQAIGLGHLPIHRVVESLQSVGYTGYLSAEILPKPDSIEAARQTMESFKKVVRS